MTSLIPGYEYDIFISYRQKDNKGDRWVSEFVDALKDELESTFKDEISVYFDINPHDGLLETHDVDASLKEKLKCLIFIPIISRTYCDPKSFAWEHEFKAFIEQASQDQFGLKVKLPNGNVSNRVLPVRIHDLDNEDIKLCESVLGGVLRGVEFIYKESGFNRPLKPDDDEKINLNKTKYRNQITKVTLAIKEIISGLKAEPAVAVKEITPDRELSAKVQREKDQVIEKQPAKRNPRRILAGTLFLALVTAAALIYPKMFNRDKFKDLKDPEGKISIAVMPFQNRTNDTIWNVWQDGIQDILITKLSNAEELRVRQTETIASLIQSKGLTNYASITPSIASTLSQKLEANVLISGSIKQAGATIRIDAQLIDSKTGEVYKSFQLDGTAEKILPTIDSLSAMVKNFLVISKLEKEISPAYSLTAATTSPEAFRYFIYGLNAFQKLDYPTARNMFLKAIGIDSNYYYAAIYISVSYGNQGLYDEAKKWCLKAYVKRDQMPIKMQILANWAYANYFETPYEEITYLKQLLEIDDHRTISYFLLGDSYNTLYQYDKAIPEFEKALEIYNKWGSKVTWVYTYTELGEAYHKSGLFVKEKELYAKAELDFPDNYLVIFRQAILSLTQGDTIAANRYIKKYIDVRKNNSTSEATIISSLAGIYSEADRPDKAEKYYRQALLLEPENATRMNNLAFFLIDKDRNIKEGMDLIDKALQLRPDNSLYLDTKGWGLYKQGKNTEALKFLEKSWELKPVYNHEIFLHLEEVKKAIANNM